MGESKEGSPVYTESWPSNSASEGASRSKRRQVSEESGHTSYSPRNSPSNRSMERLDSPRQDSKISRRRSVTLSAKFLKQRSNLQFQSSEHDLSAKARFQSCTARFLKSTYVSNFMIVVVLFDAYCTCRDIDARAAEVPTPQVLIVLSDVCLLLYTLEFFMNLIVKGSTIFRDWTLMLDVVIIVCGYADFLLNLVANSDFVVRIGMFRAFRLARIVRLMRLLRRTRALRELQKLVTMMATCMKALLWSFVFCFLIMSVWAMFIVEVVHPLIQDKENPILLNFFLEEDCDYCLRATGSVMEANLLLFKTVIAGDSWGELAVPVIQRYPATAIIFVGSNVTLVFGVLNLIVAVVVDTFAEARQRDILNLAEELEYDFEKDRKFLKGVFDRMDMDGSGLVTFEELVEGARRDPEFQSRLRVMDIDEQDLQQLFEMIDTNDQGYINAMEFIAPLSRWVNDSKTAPRFIKYNLQRTMHQQEELFIFCQDCFNSLAERLDVISERMEEQPVSLDPPFVDEPLAPVARHGSDGGASRASGESAMSAVSLVRSEPGSLASEGSLVDLRTVDPDAVTEGVEQPHASKKVKVCIPEVDELQTAMDHLEKFVLNATETALKKSMLIMGSSIRQRLGTAVGSFPLYRERSRVGDLPSKRRKYRQEKIGSTEGSMSKSASSSWAMAAMGPSQSTNSHAFSKPRGTRGISKDTTRPLPIGSFAPPKSEELSKPSAQVASVSSKVKTLRTRRSQSF